MSNLAKSVVVTIGVFDGVHAGHRYLLNQAKDIAIASNSTLTVASFDPHPVSVLRPDDFQGLLTLPEYRAKLLKAAGADRVEFIEFNKAVAKMSPDEFVETILLDQLNANSIVVGENFRFGANASGDIETFKTLSEKFGFQLSVVKLVGDRETWSSTRVRKELIAGHVATAREILGRPHRISGVVVHGDHRGRDLGYPTANLEVTNNLLIPADGVYSGLLNTLDDVFPAAISIGTNPTFADVLNRRVEAYVLDRTDLDLYDQEVSIEFIDFVRGMEKFDGIEQLVSQMAKDVENSRVQINDFLDNPSH